MTPMTKLEEFVNRIYSEAYTEAVQQDNGKITITQLDKIIKCTPEWNTEWLPLNFMEDAVGTIETWLEEAGRAAWVE